MVTKNIRYFFVPFPLTLARIATHTHTYCMGMLNILYFTKKKTTTTTTNLYILVHKKGIVVWLLLLAAHLELCEIFRTHTNPKIFLIHRIQSEGMLVKRARDRLQQSINILKCRRRIENSCLLDKLAFKLGFFCLFNFIYFI